MKLKDSILYNLIRNADKVVAFHGMMTNLASIEKRPVWIFSIVKLNLWMIIGDIKMLCMSLNLIIKIMIL